MSEIDLLTEIRDLLVSREKPHDRYFQYVGAHIREQSRQKYTHLLGLCFAVVVGVYLGGLPLHVAEIIKSAASFENL